MSGIHLSLRPLLIAALVGISVAGCGGQGASRTPTAYFVSEVIGTAPQSGNAILGFPVNKPGQVVSPVTLITSANSADLFFAVTTDVAGNLYAVVDTGKALQLDIFAATANGTAVPVRTLNLPTSTAPACTPTDDPCDYSIAVDNAGNTYVSYADVVSMTTGTIYEFAARSGGNAVPVRTLSAYCNQLAADGGGNIACANYEQGTIALYAPGQSGNTAPARLLSFGGQDVNKIIGMALDGAGNIYVAATIERKSAAPFTIYELPGGTVVTGRGTPIRTLSSQLIPQLPQFARISAVSVDTAGNLYIADPAPSPYSALFRFTPEPGGFAAPTSEFIGGNVNLAEVASFTIR